MPVPTNSSSMKFTDWDHSQSGGFKLLVDKPGLATDEAIAYLSGNLDYEIETPSVTFQNAVADLKEGWHVPLARLGFSYIYKPEYPRPATPQEVATAFAENRHFDDLLIVTPQGDIGPQTALKQRAKKEFEDAIHSRATSDGKNEAKPASMAPALIAAGIAAFGLYLVFAADQ